MIAVAAFLFLVILPTLAYFTTIRSCAQIIDGD